MSGVWRRLRRTWDTALWSMATWFAARRRVRATPADAAAHNYRQQTRGMGLRMTEFLRDRLRPGWLRVRREVDSRASDSDSHR